jgi:hypothetical protein
MEISQLNNLAVIRSADESTFSLRRNWLNYFWIFWTIAITGNPGLPMLLGSQEGMLTVTFVAMVLILLWRRDFQWPRWSAIPFAVFGLLLVIQCFSFQFFPYITIIGFFVRLSIGLMVWMLVPQLPYIFIRVMVFLTIMSFPFWIIGLTGLLTPLITRFALQSLGTEFGIPRLSLIMHTYVMAPNGLDKGNSGMLWEGGAFAGFLNLASIFLLLMRPEFSAKTYKKYLFILTAGAFSTMSTAGYVVLCLLLFLHSVRSEPMSRLTRFLKYRVSFLRIVIVGSILIVVGIIAWSNVPFLGDKIKEQYGLAIRREGERWYVTRFGSLILDLDYIKARPFTGWGLHSKTRWALHRGVEALEFTPGMGNGLSDFAACFGLIGFTTFACLTWLGLFRFSRRSTKLAWIALGLIFIMMNGEAFLDHPFFLCLMFSNLRKS